MPQKPKTGRGKETPRKKALSQKAQSARFIKTARAFGADESGKEFDRVFKTIARKRSG